MSHNTHEGIRNLSPVSSISLALLFFYFITSFSFLLYIYLPLIPIYRRKKYNVIILLQ